MSTFERVVAVVEVESASSEDSVSEVSAEVVSVPDVSSDAVLSALEAEVDDAAEPQPVRRRTADRARATFWLW